MPPKGASSAAATEEKKQDLSSLDAVFRYDKDHIDTLRKEAPYNRKENPRFFKYCKISALAAMKILNHALVGVRKGRASESGMAIEVMGMLLGKPEGETIVIMDAFPLPVEGEANFVEAGPRVAIYQTQLMDSFEKTRKETFIGWYHSHPFDVDVKSNCFMSNTDVATQAAYQRVNPIWVAVVCDPLRSLAKQEPQLGCYRTYPQDYTSPATLGPDGSSKTQEELIARWGHGYNRYYSMDIQYFMSGLGNKVLNLMSRNNLWVRVLSSTATLEQEYRDRLPERIAKGVQKLDQAAKSSDVSGSGGYGRGWPRGGGKQRNDTLEAGLATLSELAAEQAKGEASQVCKDLLFNAYQNVARVEAASSKS